jgi:hypothetical protein
VSVCFLASLWVSSLAAADAPLAVGNPAVIQLSPPGTPTADQDLYLVPQLPSATNNTGAAILIISSQPLYKLDVASHEGLTLASWLNAHGIAAFDFSYVNPPPDLVGAVHFALQYLHAHAADFHLSPKRIGLLGFGSGAALAANATFANPDSTDPAILAASHPDFLALIAGASLPAAPATLPPATFLVGSTNTADNLSTMIDLWNYLRSPRIRVPVEAHFFPKMVPAAKDLLGPWPDLFYNWIRAYGFLTDQPRVAIHGTVSLDGRPLPFGYLILTPLDGLGAGPIVAHVFNSTAGVAIGSFSVPAKLGPTPGRYRVDVRQNANRWLSNSFSSDLIRDPAFGHSRILSPSIDDQHSYTKIHPGDNDDLTLTISPEGNLDLNIAVFSQ